MRRFRKGFRILTYHRFPPDAVDAFDRQCRHLRRHYQPVPMRDIASSLQAGKPLPRNAIAVTVDDGYRDFYEYAAPVLQAYRIPATFFLVSAFIDRLEWLWWDPLLYALERTARRQIQFGDFGTVGISSAAEKAAAFGFITEKLKILPNRRRRGLLAELIARLDVPQPRETPAEFAPISWEEARSLRRQGIEFGAHTRTHPILSRLETQRELTDEIVSGKERIERELREPVMHFSYPNGEPADFNDTVLKTVRSAGFSTSVTTVRGLNSPGCDPFLLKRIPVDPVMPPEYFAELVAGMHCGD